MGYARRTLRSKALAVVVSTLMVALCCMPATSIAAPASVDEGASTAQSLKESKSSVEAASVKAAGLPPAPLIGFGDAYESDNTSATASTIVFNDEPQSHSLNVFGDEDWITFEAIEGGTYWITTGSDHRTDTDMYLYDADGVTELEHNDDAGHAAEDARYSHIEYTAVADSALYVQVIGYDFMETGDYVIHIENSLDEYEAHKVDADEYENDNSFTMATPVPVNAPAQSHTIHFNADEDWMSFEVLSGVTYYVSTGYGDGMDTELYLYESDGTTELRYDDDDGEDLYSYLEIVADADETLFAQVISYDQGETGSYTFSVTADAIADEYESDDTSLTATPFVVGGADQSHTIHVVDDEDWVSFEVVAGVTYYVSTGYGDGMDTELYLYESDGTTELRYDDDDGEDLYSYLEIVADADETLFAQVISYDQGETGSYTFSVTADAIADEYESDDTSLTATPFVVGGADQSHTIHVVDDEDWVSFEAVAGVTYYVETLPTALTDDSDTEVYLYGPDGVTELAYDDDYGIGYYSHLEYSASADETLYVQVHSRDMYYTGEYGFRVFTDAPLRPYDPEPVAGQDRFNTAVDASAKAFPEGSDAVVIATAWNWPDALGGTALAGAINAPILLVDTSAIPEIVMGEIERLGAGEAIILGGTNAISGDVEAELVELMGEEMVTRLGGATRYETAEIVAAFTVAQLGDDFDGTCFVATGDVFADALSASPLAAAKGWPVYLSSDMGVSPATLTAMQAAGVTDVLLLGGEAAVTPETAITILAADMLVVRIDGANRYETAAKVAAYGVSNAGLQWDGLAVATGQNFPDALAGGAMQGMMGSVMLLTQGDVLSPDTAACLQAKKDAIGTIVYLGGENAVSQVVRDSAGGIVD